MRIKFPAIIKVIAGMLAVAVFIIPANMVSPATVSADPGIMRWDTVLTPGYLANKWDIDNLHGLGANMGQGSEIIDMAAGNDGKTVVAIVRMWVPDNTGGIASPGGAYKNIVLMSFNGGISFSDSLYHTQFPNALTAPNFFEVEMATDNPLAMILTSEDFSGTHTGPRLVWETGWVLGYAPWSVVFDGTSALSAGETIRCADVSPDYGGYRDVAFGTEGPTGGRWGAISSKPYGTTQVQLNANGTPPQNFGTASTSGIDYEALRFSPTYGGDASVALVYADVNATYYNVAFRDINQNTTVNYAFTSPGIEVKNPTSAPLSSPNWSQLNRTDLELPSDFSGQSSSLRRVYISLDAFGSKAVGSCEDGIYRIDDTTPYVLMDTTTTPDKSIYSIAYYGTYASGKLLAGERMGQPCAATVPTWFTDSPTTCPIPCWYPALKPATGAGNQGACNTGAKNGAGSAVVRWNGDGSLGLVATGSLPDTVYANQPGRVGGGVELPGTPTATAAGKGLWYQMQGGSGASFVPPVALAVGFDAVNNDESAFAVSRNNGETWNELAIIDTTIDWFNDVAVSPDCTTIYLASVNENTGIGCNQFDSVWRSTINPNVAAPLPAIPPLGTYWERVFCHVTAGNCSLQQSKLPILRVVESCTDKPTGEIVAWAAQYANATSSSTSGGVMAWSPDYGDYWASITPRYPVQDFAFETSTTMYVLSADGIVQRLPYTGTSWTTNLPNYDTQLLYGHTIAAVPDGKVLVGAGVNAPYPMAYSLDKGVTMSVLADPIAGHGNEHVIFDVDFANNSFIYMADDSVFNNSPNFTVNNGGTAVGTVYRNTIPANTRWVDGDMMSAANGNGYVFSDDTSLWWSTGGSNNPPHIVGQFGLVQAWTGDPQPALYSAHDNVTNSSGYQDSAVCRTLKPRDGMPKPGIKWACLDIFAPLNQKNVFFTLEPTSLKACGCCTLDTNTTLYAIDNERYGALADLAGRWNFHLLDTAASAWNDNPGYTPTANQGMLWAYTDCLAKKGPVLKTPADQFLVGADPVTGRNQQIDLAWEQLCLSIWYQLQIAKDKDFTLRVNPAVNWGNGSTGVISAVTGSLLMQMDTTNNTSPAAWIPPGSLPEAGAIYYWRIRSAKSATTQIADSPWSETRSFTIKAGFVVTSNYLGVELLSPGNSATGITTKPTQFSWSPWQDATKYEFDLAKDSEFKQMVVTANTTTTAYQYANALDYNAVYFWRVKAVEVNGQNIPSDWSATFTFTTETVPIIPPPPTQAPIPVWVWVLMALGSIIAVGILFLIMRTRRI